MKYVKRRWTNRDYDWLTVEAVRHLSPLAKWEKNYAIAPKGTKRRDTYDHFLRYCAANLNRTEEAVETKLQNIVTTYNNIRRRKPLDKACWYLFGAAGKAGFFDGLDVTAPVSRPQRRRTSDTRTWARSFDARA
jgi:hypothetical protein